MESVLFFIGGAIVGIVLSRLFNLLKLFIEHRKSDKAMNIIAEKLKKGEFKTAYGIFDPPNNSDNDPEEDNNITLIYGGRICYYQKSNWRSITLFFI